MTLLPRLARYRDRLLFIGGALIAIALLIAAALPEALVGWLAAFLLWTNLPIGLLLIALMRAIIPGPWQRELAGIEGAALASWMPAVMAGLPVLIGLPALYGWAANTAGDGFRGVYLTPWFFALRTILFFAAAGALNLALLRMPARATNIAVAGLIAFIPLQMVVATDWIVSLDPDFHSSGFGLYLLSVQALTALSVFVPLRLQYGARTAGLLGGPMLTALLLWAYFAFMQYFISWSDNLPPIVHWYGVRRENGWGVVEILIAVLGLLPAGMLLFGAVRRSSALLAVLCLIVLTGKLFEIAWLVLPQRTTTAAFAVMALGGAGLACSGLALLAGVTAGDRRSEAAVTSDYGGAP